METARYLPTYSRSPSPKAVQLSRVFGTFYKVAVSSCAQPHFGGGSEGEKRLISGQAGYLPID